LTRTPGSARGAAGNGGPYRHARGNLWEKARRLRAEGWSLRQIARHLDVSLSSASVWTRGAAPPPPPPAANAVLPAPPSEPLRWCSRCAASRPASCFNRHPTGRQWWCRDCFKAYYAERRADHRRRNNALKAIRVEAAQSLVLAYLRSHPCLDCGKVDPIVLEFDHVGTKRADVSTLVRRGVREPVLLAEIARCEVVCANCHRRRTARRGRWRRLQPDGGNRSSRSKAHARNLRTALEALAASGCVDCGESDVCVLDFDHVGEKTATITQLVRREASLQRLRDEIARCEVRCANCHRRRTAISRGHYRALAEIPPARVELALPD
jgi:hypothetical protein